MSSYKDLKKRLLKNDEFASLYKTKKPLMEFLNDVIDVMNEKNITQAELAKRIGLEKSNMSRIMSGKQNVSYEMMKKIADALEEDILITFSKDQFVKMNSGNKETLERIMKTFKLSKEETLASILSACDSIIGDSGSYYMSVLKRYKKRSNTDFVGALSMLIRSGAEGVEDFLNQEERYSSEVEMGNIQNLDESYFDYEYSDEMKEELLIGG
jgi:transcriptional regulator with XRE-family HTH domain